MPTDLAALRDEYLPALRSTLNGNVLDFWFPRCIDGDEGGFLTSYDVQGSFAGNDRKQIVTQARMVWLTARFDSRRDPFVDLRRHR